MNSKKAITLLVLTTMLIALVPVIQVQAAIAITSITPGTDDKGSTIKVIGAGVVAGKTVKLYWDLVQAWDGEAGLLNSSKAKSSGAYEVWFKVPESVAGEHFIWVEDSQTLLTDDDPFTVTPKVSLSSDSGLDGDKITVTYYGLADETDVGISFSSTDALSQNDADAVEGDGALSEYSGTLDEEPVLPGTVHFSNITSGVWDNGDGTFGGANADPINGTINYATGEWELTFLSVLAVGQNLDADYKAFADSATIKVLTTAGETNTLGTGSKLVTIPDYAATNYDIWVVDAKGNNGTDSFALGPVITLNKEDGPVGTVVEISGRGFNEDDYVMQIWLDDKYMCYNTSEAQVGAKDTFKVSFVVPSVPDLDDYEVKVYVDDLQALPSPTTATADFEVTGLAEIKLTPEYGGVNDRITINAYNFSQIANSEVILNFTKVGSDDKYAATFKTTSSGTFTGTFRVPAASNDIWVVNATQVDHQINATANFRVGMMLALVAPDEAPQGSKVTLSGVGFEDSGAGEDWNATLGGVLIGEDTAETDGTFTHVFYVPNVDPGTYTIEVYDIDAEITVTTEFTVTDVTYLEIDPIQAANDYNITIYGYFFSEDENTDLEFTLYNTTDEWDLTGDVYQYDPDLDEQVKDPLAMDDDGVTFVGWWQVYDVDTLSTGTYWLNVTDDNDIFAQIRVDVVSEVVDVSPKKSTYGIGDTIAFNVKSTFRQLDAYFKIYDPSGNLYWKSDDLGETSWLKVGYEQVVPFYAQTSGGNPMILVSDAPQGVWTWKLYDSDDDVLEEGTFTVTAAAADVLAEQIEDLNSAVTELTTDISTVSTEVAAVRTQITNAINAANAAVQAANAATQAVNAVAQTASAASTAATAAAAAATEAKNAANGLTTLVYGAIGASLVAALAAIVSLMQISRRIAG